MDSIRACRINDNGAVMSIYAVTSGKNNQYHVIKFDEDYNYESTYNVDPYNNTCNCPANNRESCRHRQLVSKFRLEAKVDRGWAYDYDNNIWHEPTEE